MTSHNGLPDPEQTSPRYRGRLHEELGLAVDLFENPAPPPVPPIPPVPQGPPVSPPNGGPSEPYGYGNPPGYGVPVVGADETEMFIESLRAGDDEHESSWMGEPRNGRGRHAEFVEVEPVPEEYALFGAEYTGYVPQPDPLGAGAVGDPFDTGDEHDVLIQTPDLARRDLPPQREAPDGPELRNEPARQRPTSAHLTAESVLRRRGERPTTGWRRAVYTVTAGQINPGPSRAEIRERELVNRARTPLRGCHRLAVISLKGGVGKTTTTACLGSMFATLRGDRVIAMDANPDRGTLGEKVPRTSGRTVRDLVNNAARLARYADVREFTSQAPSRLEVLASDSDPFVSMAFSENDYRVGVDILESYYNLILTDCGTGLLHSAMVGVLGLADSLIIVSSASLDGARSASATLDWLEHHGYDSLVRHSVAVISTVHPSGGNVDVGKLEDHFAARCRAVVRIPFDRHLEAGGVIELDDLEPATYDAYLQLAAEVGDGFAIPPRLG